MRRTISSVSVWLTVTVVAIMLSWWGVRSVLRDTVFEPPRAPTLVAGDRPPPQLPESSAPPVAKAVRSVTPTPAPDVISQTNRQTTSPPSATAGPTATTSKQPPPPTTAPPPPPPPPAPAPAPPSPTNRRENERAGDVHSFEVRGGRASFKYRDQSATLVAATPKSGWSVKVWPADNWIRVDFTNRGHTSSVFVVWNEHTPIASTYES